MTTTARTTAVLIGALAAAWGLSACTSGGEPTTPPTTAVTSAAPTPTKTAAPEPTPTPTPTPTAGGDEALPAGFPDPASLIGKDSYDARSADGSWHWVVGGTPLSLVTTFGACFDGPSGETCGYSIGGSAVVEPGGTPEPTDAALLALFRSTGTMADGTPTWVVVDAVVVRPPSRGPGLLELCDSPQTAAIYPKPGTAPGGTIPAQAAWAPNADATALVEIDPASLTCAYSGD